MLIFQEIKKRLGALWPFLIAGFILLYFIYHLIGGEHGLIAWRRLDHNLTRTQETLKTYKTEEEKLELWTKQLKNPISPDLLEEQVGKRLNLHHPNDRVLLPAQ